MLATEIYRRISGDRRRHELACQGLNPFVAEAVPVAELPVLVPPHDVIGGTGSDEEWRRAVEGLETDLSVAAAVLCEIEKQSKQGQTWDKVGKRLNKIETALYSADTRSTDIQTVTFDRYPYLFDVPLDDAKQTGCAVDFWRGHLVLAEQNGAGSRVDLGDADVVLSVYPESCAVRETGSLRGVLADESSGWVAEISGAENIEFVLTIRLPRPVNINTVEIEYTGRAEVRSVSAGQNNLFALNPARSIWVMEAAEASVIRIAFAKQGYDSREGFHYFALQSIAAYLRQYVASGSYVSHAIPVFGSAATLSVAASVPPHTSLRSYIGFQRGKQVVWHQAEKGQSIPVPWEKETINEAFSSQAAPTYAGMLQRLHTLQAQPDAFSVELYPGYGCWALETIDIEGETVQADAATWHELAAWHRPVKQYIRMEETVALQPARLYRFSAFIRCREAQAVKNWYPGTTGCDVGAYINHRRQQSRQQDIDLQFEPGWNLMEIVVLPTVAGYFNMLFDFRQVGDVSSAIKGSARTVAVRDLLLSAPTLHSCAVDGRDILVNYDVENMPEYYLCRYYIKREDVWYSRVMFVMETKAPDFSPAVYSYSVRYGREP